MMHEALMLGYPVHTCVQASQHSSCTEFVISVHDLARATTDPDTMQKGLTVHAIP